MVEDDGGRVTTREFYDALMKTNSTMNDALIKQNTTMMETERRIIGRLDVITACLPKIENQLATNKEEIEKLRTRSNNWDAGNTLGIIIAGVLSAIGLNNR